MIEGCRLGVAAAVAVPLAAQAVCGPVVAMLAGQVSLVAVLANVLVAPAVAPATVLGVLATVVSVVSDRLASLIADVAAAARVVDRHGRRALRRRPDGLGRLVDVGARPPSCSRC